MLYSRQLFNHIRRYTHNHTSSAKNFVKTDTTLENKIDKLSFQLENIYFLLNCNYAISVVFGLCTVFK
jgi:hypothetical protein